MSALLKVLWADLAGDQPALRESSHGGRAGGDEVAQRQLEQFEVRRAEGVIAGSGPGRPHLPQAIDLAGGSLPGCRRIIVHGGSG